MALDPTTRGRKSKDFAAAAKLLGNQTVRRRRKDELENRATVTGSHPLMTLDVARDMINRVVGTIRVTDYEIEIKLGGGKRFLIVESGEGLEVIYDDVKPTVAKKP